MKSTHFGFKITLLTWANVALGNNGDDPRQNGNYTCSSEVCLTKTYNKNELPLTPGQAIIATFLKRKNIFTCRLVPCSNTN